jgi:hypothetical protein
MVLSNVEGFAVLGLWVCPECTSSWSFFRSILVYLPEASMICHPKFQYVRVCCTEAQ